MIQVRSFFRDVPNRVVGTPEHKEQIAKVNGTTIERIVTYGQAKPGEWYDDPRSEHVTVVRGEAEILFEEGQQRIKMTSGDHIVIPPHKRHRVEYAKNRTIWHVVYF